MTEPTAAQLPAFGYATVPDAAQQLRGAAHRDGHDYKLLLFNTFEPDDTTWWLTPKREKSSEPAYDLGKIALVPWDVAKPGALFVGLHIEKGVTGPKAEEMFGVTARGRRLLMTDQWIWPRFMKALASGRVTDEAAAAEAEAGLPLTVAVIAAIQNVPISDRDGPRPPNPKFDLVRFGLSGGRLTVIEDRSEQRHLTGLARAESLPEVAAKIQEIHEADWLWVEFLIGLRFTASDSSGGAAWAAADVWAKAGRPWLDWLD